MDKIRDILHPKRPQDDGKISAEEQRSLSWSPRSLRGILQRLTFRSTPGSGQFRIRVTWLGRKTQIVFVVVLLLAVTATSVISRRVRATFAVRQAPAAFCFAEGLALPTTLPMAPGRTESAEGASAEETQNATPPAGEEAPTQNDAEEVPSGSAQAAESGLSGQGWFAADRAAGIPDLGPRATLREFSVGNSARWTGGPSAIVCSGFAVPEGRRLEPALGLSLAIVPPGGLTGPGLPPASIPIPEEIPVPQPEFEIIETTPMEGEGSVPGEEEVVPGDLSGQEEPIFDPIDVPVDTFPIPEGDAPVEEEGTPEGSTAPPEETSTPPDLSGQDEEEPPETPPADEEEPQASFLDRVRSRLLGARYVRAQAVDLSEDSKANVFSRVFSAAQSRLFASVIPPNALDVRDPSFDVVLRVSLSIQGGPWIPFHTIDRVPYSNDLNGGYLLVDLPQEFAENLADLRVRVEGLTAGDTDIEALLDSVFISYLAADENELEVEPLDLEGAVVDTRGELAAFGRGRPATFRLKVLDPEQGTLGNLVGGLTGGDDPQPPADVHVAILNALGELVPSPGAEVTWQGRGAFGYRVWDLAVPPPRTLPPGRAELFITYLDDDGNEQATTYPFLWGTLVLNTDKTVYRPDDTVSFEMGVHDADGTIICDAPLTLEITGPSRHEILSAEEGTIALTPACASGAAAGEADYTATFSLKGVLPDFQAGTYRLILTATVDEGVTTSIEDTFIVRDRVPLDITRRSATRVLPGRLYAVTATILANEDFSGTIVEPLPESFVMVEQGELEQQTTIELPKGEALPADEEGVVPVTEPVTGEEPITSPQEEPSVGEPQAALPLVPEAQAQALLPESTERPEPPALPEIPGIEAEGPTEAESPVPSPSTGSGQDEGEGEPSAPVLQRTIEDTLVLLGVDEPLAQYLTWDVDLKAGAVYELSYIVQVPQESPQLWLLGPLRFVGQDAQATPELFFAETRPWQLTADITDPKDRKRELPTHECTITPFSQKVVPGESLTYEVTLLPTESRTRFRLLKGNTPPGMTMRLGDETGRAREGDTISLLIDTTSELKSANLSLVVQYLETGRGGKISRNHCQLNVIIE